MSAAAPSQAAPIPSWSDTTAIPDIVSPQHSNIIPRSVCDRVDDHEPARHVTSLEEHPMAPHAGSALDSTGCDDLNIHVSSNPYATVSMQLTHQDGEARTLASRSPMAPHASAPEAVPVVAANFDPSGTSKAESAHSENNGHATKNTCSQSPRKPLPTHWLSKSTKVPVLKTEQRAIEREARIKTLRSARSQPDFSQASSVQGTGYLTKDSVVPVQSNLTSSGLPLSPNKLHHSKSTLRSPPISPVRSSPGHPSTIRIAVSPNRQREARTSRPSSTTSGTSQYLTAVTSPVSHSPSCSVASFRTASEHPYEHDIVRELSDTSYCGQECTETTKEATKTRIPALHLRGKSDPPARLPAVAGKATFSRRAVPSLSITTSNLPSHAPARKPHSYLASPTSPRSAAPASPPKTSRIPRTSDASGKTGKYGRVPATLQRASLSTFSKAQVSVESIGPANDTVLSLSQLKTEVAPPRETAVALSPHQARDVIERKSSGTLSTTAGESTGPYQEPFSTQDNSTKGENDDTVDTPLSNEHNVVQSHLQDSGFPPSCYSLAASEDEGSVVFDETSAIDLEDPSRGQQLRSSRVASDTTVKGRASEDNLNRIDPAVLFSTKKSNTPHAPQQLSDDQDAASVACSSSGVNQLKNAHYHTSPVRVRSHLRAEAPDFVPQHRSPLPTEWSQQQMQAAQFPLFSLFDHDTYGVPLYHHMYPVLTNTPPGYWSGAHSPPFKQGKKKHFGSHAAPRGRKYKSRSEHSPPKLHYSSVIERQKHNELEGESKVAGTTGAPMLERPSSCKEPAPESASDTGREPFSEQLKTIGQHVNEHSQRGTGRGSRNIDWTNIHNVPSSTTRFVHEQTARPFSLGSYHQPAGVYKELVPNAQSTLQPHRGLRHHRSSGNGLYVNYGPASRGFRHGGAGLPFESTVPFPDPLPPRSNRVEGGTVKQYVGYAIKRPEVKTPETCMEMTVDKAMEWGGGTCHKCDPSH